MAIKERNLATGAVTSAKIADGTIVAGDMAIFISTNQTGTGSAQNIAHGLGVTPSKVFVALTGGPGTYAAPSISEGSHNATNVVVTVTSGWSYRVIAIA